MLAAWLKLLHIAALSVWAGGLLALPGQLARERRAARQDPAAGLGPLWQHRVSRFAYDAVVSPAAIVAIASGTALIFATRPLEGWLFLKLVGVTALVAVHMYTGRIIDQIEEPDLRPTARRARLMFLLALVCICLILWLVLKKPAIPEAMFPAWLLQGPAEPPIGLPLGQRASPMPLTPT